MTSINQELRLATFTDAALPSEHLDAHRELYERNRKRILAIAFWMTDNELMAEGILRCTFTRALSSFDAPNPEALDHCLISELRTLMDLGTLTLECTPPTRALGIRHNTLREHLERSVMQLPATERLIFVFHDVEGYSHARIAKLLDLTVPEVQLGLHQARLRVRELVAAMENYMYAAAC